MKTIIGTALLLVTLAATAGQPSEADCLGMGSLGETVAKARRQGGSEGALIKKIPQFAQDPAHPTAYELRAGVVIETVIKFVFSMKLPPTEARKIIYKKCSAGDFGSYALK